jgi:hypothetical protein
MNWKPLVRTAVVLLLAAMDLYCSTRSKKGDGMPVRDVWR